LKSTKKNIKIRKIEATLDNFTKILSNNTIGLHFSGHGAKQSEKYFNKGIKDKGDILIFEQEDGTPLYLPEKRLQEILKSSKSF